jgi:hypothetical protein
MNPDLIVKLFRYFARFVPEKALREMLIQPDISRFPGYSETEAEILDPVDPVGNVRIPVIEKYIFSINENFVSERIKNAKGFILFVEYGIISADFKVANGLSQALSLTLVHPFSDANHDNLQETLLMNRCLGLLMQILRQLLADEDQLDFCADLGLLDMPVEIQPVDPVRCFGAGGWTAMLTASQTVLLP